MDSFIGQIEIFGGNFPPVGWAFCNGQLLSIAQNDALFSLLGTTYGGDGQTTFAVPDLRGRSAVGFGQGPGLSSYPIGATIGQEQVTLLQTQLPAHSHALLASNSDGTSNDPSVATLAKSSVVVERGGSPIPVNSYTSANANFQMGASSVAPFGGGNVPHPNEQPALVLNYIISLYGIYPSQG